MFGLNNLILTGENETDTTTIEYSLCGRVIFEFLFEMFTGKLCQFAWIISGKTEVPTSHSQSVCPLFPVNRQNHQLDKNIAKSISLVM